MNINLGFFSDRDDNGGFGLNNFYLFNDGNNYYDNVIDFDFFDNIYYY